MGAHMSKFLGNLRLTFAIAAMTVGALVALTVAVLGGLFLSVSGSVQTDLKEALSSSTRVAAQIFYVNLPNLTVETDETGNVSAILAQRMPRFRNHDVIDAVAKVAGQSVAIYVYDPEVGPDLMVGSTSMIDVAGER